MNVTTQSFEQDVIRASHSKPVLVDFWAPWCGPCRFLGPVLEKLANEQSDNWTLAKVNVDENQELSQRYGVRGIPAVKLFVDGKMVDEFTGALPEPAIKQWLEKALPTQAKEWLVMARNYIDAGEKDEAIKVLDAILEVEPNNPEARILLAGQIIYDDPQKASELAQGGAFAGTEYVQQEAAIQVVAALLQLDPEALPEGGGRESYMQAVKAIHSGDLDTALTHLIKVIQVDRYYMDDAARKTGVSLFTLLGEDHPISRKHRRTFDMWLY